MVGIDPVSLGLGATGIVGDIIGNILGSSARKKQQEILDKQQSDLTAAKEENQNYYNQNYYANQLNRTENAAALNRANEFFKARTAQDRKTAAVTGATPEAVNADKAQYSNAYSNLVGNIASNASSQRDAIRANYENQLNNLTSQQNQLNAENINLLNQKANAAGNFTTNASNIASSAVQSGLTPNFSNPYYGSLNTLATPKASLNVDQGIDPSKVVMPLYKLPKP